MRSHKSNSPQLSKRSFLTGGLATLGGLSLTACYSDNVSKPPNNDKKTSSFSENPPPSEASEAMTIEDAAINGEISVSDFALLGGDEEINEFEQENSFSFDENVSFGDSEESAFGEGFSGSFAAEEAESFSFDGKPENRQAPTPKPPRRNPRFQDHNLTSEQAYARAERTIGIPARVLRRIVNNEAISGNPNSVNPTTGACGLGQLMPESTLPEMAYKYGPTFGFSIGDMVDRYIVGKTRGLDIIGYRPHRGERPNLRAQCLDEWTNVALFSMNLIEKMRRVDDQLTRKGRRITFNEADIYIGHFLGARADIMWARRSNPNGLAINLVTSRTIRQNRHMFYDSNNRPRTVAGMYHYINKGGPGPDERHTVAPFWRTETTQIAARAQLALNAG